MILIDEEKHELVFKGDLRRLSIQSQLAVFMVLSKYNDLQKFNDFKNSFINNLKIMLDSNFKGLEDFINIALLPDEDYFNLFKRFEEEN